jgi:tRNA (adenine57-N1/adenine58-N1)-methyltransferase
MSSRRSPFLFPGTIATAEKLSIVHLKRDLQLPTLLKDRDEDDEGYIEGKVVNTRFGSFPHSTLIGIPWGSQVRASRVDTGSRGRRGQPQEKKLKRKEPPPETDGPSSKRSKTGEGKYADVEATPAPAKEEAEAVVAKTGFIHLLPPTPENWTSSLPHRTQVVYTPDYSYILHRIRARPGTNIIEAGAGSGSFTHASARSVYNGYPGSEADSGRLGKVWSFEFHEQRHAKLQEELKEHELDGLVEVTHRDVCGDGFLVNGESPKADAIFLDLPAPWLALPHLTRSRRPPSKTDSITSTSDESTPFISPLNPSSAVHICTFSPCIEQVQKTVSVMRHLGWVDISMVEAAHKRFEIRRERIGIDNGAQRGLQTAPASVEEALQRLLEVEGNFQKFHSTGEKVVSRKKKNGENPNSREAIVESLVDRKVYKEGRLCHRTEPDVKTHTSYLVFACLPMEWSAEDEEKAKKEWPVNLRLDSEDVKEIGEGEAPALSKRQMKKAARQAQRETAAKQPTEAPATEEVENMGDEDE